MPPETIKLSVNGPFNWLCEPGSVPCIFDARESQEHGIYFWTVRHDDGERVHYVGETGRTFAVRFREHLFAYLSGQYHIYEPADFASGVRRSLWDGMWRSGGETQAAAFLDRAAHLLPALHQNLRDMRLWLVPITVERRTRCLIEGAIARALSDQPESVGAFQEPDIKYQYRDANDRDANEPSVEVEMPEYPSFVGLPSRLQT